MSPAMSPALSTPEAPRARGRWQLILLLLVAIGPMILSTAMYQWRFWVPDSRNYHGALIGDGSQLADIGAGIAELRPRIDGDDDMPHIARRIEGRDLGGLNPVEGDVDDAGEIAVIIHLAQGAGVFAPCGRQNVLPSGAIFGQGGGDLHQAGIG